MSTANRDIFIDPGSYRDPAGSVFYWNGNIYRTINRVVRNEWQQVLNTGLLTNLREDGLLVDWELEGDKSLLNSFSNPENIDSLIRLKRIPFISYPYEWSFSGLKKAALLHLDIHLKALSSNIMLVDSSAYNVQFIGPKPIFIDHLSFRPYKEGQLWEGHKQFIEQFICPLLITSHCKFPFQNIYRGSFDGVPLQQLAKMLPISTILNWRILGHIFIPAWLEAKKTKKSSGSIDKPKHLTRKHFRGMLEDLKSWVLALKSPQNHGFWVDYETSNSYTNNDEVTKTKFVSKFITETRPKVVYDLGCNTGFYSELAIKSGAALVIGFENDSTTLDAAYTRADQQNINFLPLFQGMNNPSPGQGWAGLERQNLDRRIASGKGVILALAIIHHLAISHNVPIDKIIRWIISLGNSGILEFVPKEDPMVQQMLTNRSDIFNDYTEEIFIFSINESGCKIVKKEKLSSGRLLVAYQKIK